MSRTVDGRTGGSAWAASPTQVQPDWTCTTERPKANPPDVSRAGYEEQQMPILTLYLLYLEEVSTWSRHSFSPAVAAWARSRSG